MPQHIPAPLDESQLAVLVGRFHDRVRVDTMLGPVFNPRIDDWDAHKVLMTSFRATIALRSGHYRGNPLARPQPLPIGIGHFERWLALWRETAGEVLDADAATLMIGYAERAGHGRRMGLGLGGHQRHRESGVPIRVRQPVATR